MKTLIVTLNPSGEGLDAISQVPDSALLTGGRPLFLRDDRDTAWLELMPAVRISRLGLGVSRRFAPRYFDAATIVALNLPSPDARLPLPDTLLVADNALITGNWQPVPQQPLWVIESGSHSLTLDMAGAFEQAIEAVTERSTIKTGDIIVLPPRKHLRIEVSPGRHAACTLQGLGALDFKVV
ncbi:MAG: hypothetical protein K2L21_09800 [Muribaculaceae bacterium]|nr:hypothetical protein [Muribaculaceae bacterium]